MQHQLGDNVYRSINTVGIWNACSRSFRLVPTTNVFLRSCTRIRHIRNARAATRQKHAMPSIHSYHGVMHQAKSGCFSFPSHSFLSFSLSASNTCLHPNSTRQNITVYIRRRISFLVAGVSQATRAQALETRRGSENVYGKRIWSWILRKCFVFVETRRTIERCVYETHVKHTSKR